MAETGMSRKYRDQYVLQTVETKDGPKRKTVYTGKYFTAHLPEDKLGKYKAALKGISLITAVLFVGMGLVNNAGSRVIYVILPYAILVLPVFYMLMTTISFGRAKDKLTFPEYDKIFVRMRTAGMGALILAAAGAVGVVVFILSGKGNTPGMEILFLAGYIGIAFLAFLCLQIHNKVQFTQEDGTDSQTETSENE